ncbi:MAG: dTDP-4-dehydrorhamnose 3,5-epimerase [Azonexus sp.]|nr:dTDP-4-dehydrorhamnose 3,5-epimerase [Azonexus sp.]
MARFDFVPTPIAGLTLVQRLRLEDNRGFLSRFYCAEEFKAAGVHQSIAQINHTLTRSKGTVRGMHFQLSPYAETKIVSCLHGEVFDVAVDLRKNSVTFLQWHGAVLSAENQRSLLIPEGFAHGFQALTDDCELIYLHTAAYQPDAEGAANANDPRLAIAWPLKITEMSDRDCAHPLLDAEFKGFEP